VNTRVATVADATTVNAVLSSYSLAGDYFVSSPTCYYLKTLLDWLDWRGNCSGMVERKDASAATGASIVAVPLHCCIFGRWRRDYIAECD